MTNDQINKVGSLVEITRNMLSSLTDEERALWFEKFNKIKDTIVTAPPRGWRTGKRRI